jgi:hypothetical protein
MKVIYGFLLLVIAAACTGGLYLIIRKPDQKKTDLEKLKSVCEAIAHHLHRFGKYLHSLYAIVVSGDCSSSSAERNQPQSE